MQKKLLVLSACLLGSIISFGQEKMDENDAYSTPKVYNYVEQMPTTSYSLKDYLSQNTHYPDSAIAQNLEGRVIVKFLVDQSGNIDSCSIFKSVSPECDAEALRIVRDMPRWKPGRQNGKPVKVYFTLPIVFKLMD